MFTMEKRQNPVQHTVSVYEYNFSIFLFLFIFSQEVEPGVTKQCRFGVSDISKNLLVI